MKKWQLALCPWVLDEKGLTVLEKLLYNMNMDHIEQFDQDFASLPQTRYDIVTKNALQQFPEDILRTVLEGSDFTFVGFVEGEFTTVDIRRTDSLIQVRLGDDLALVHIEFQVSDSAPLEMARRNVGYLGRCYELAVFYRRQLCKNLQSTNIS